MIWIPLVVIGWIGSPSAQDADAALAETLAPHVQSLAELAAWCESEGMLREEADVWAAVVGLDPNHSHARKATGYELDRGEWRRPQDWTPPKRTNRKARKEYRRRRDEIVDVLAGDVLDALARFDGVTPRRRRHLLAGLLELDPRHAELREAAGERRRRGRWVLAETVTSVERARELRAQCRQVVRRTPEPEVVSTGTVEAKIGLPWTGARHLTDLKISGTVSDAELTSACRIASATRDLIAEVLGVSPALPEPFTLYLLSGGADRDAFLHFHPAIDADSRRFLSRVATGWIPDRWEVGVWATDPESREEWVVRQTLALLLKVRFGVTERQGMLFEGVGLYLGFLLTGRREAWYVAGSRYALDDEVFDAKTLSEKKDWLAVARRLRSRRDRPDYRSLMSRDTNGMTSADLIEAWALASWLIEGHPGRTRSLLEAIGSGQRPDQAVMTVFGLTLPELEDRVGRWLRERS